MNKLITKVRNLFLAKEFLEIGPISVARTKSLAGLLGKLRYLESRSSRELEVVETSKAQRSVIFVNNSYYNFYYLARALRARGWNALSVSLEDPQGPHSGFYHGCDVCLFDADPVVMYRKIADFVLRVEREFRMVHFYGKGTLSFFPSEFDKDGSFDNLPFDIIRFKQAGVKIGYSICGCLDGVSQTTMNRWSEGCCDRCVWQDNQVVCNDRSNLAWGHKVHMLCDLIATEGFPALEYQSGRKTFRNPLTTALDPDLWHPNIDVPERYKFQRSPGELIVYHAVGNFELRSQNDRNIKGTPAVVKAIDRLRTEGVNVRLEFATGLPSTEVRFLQVQADVIVDQLNHGRYGATAREGLMLGRPTICHINKNEMSESSRLESIEECPLVSANESTIYEVLHDLLSNNEKRMRIGKESRAYALKWHSADACAERYEKVFDDLVGADK